jgi:hypothetical protein
VRGEPEFVRDRGGESERRRHRCHRVGRGGGVCHGSGTVPVCDDGWIEGKVLFSSCGARGDGRRARLGQASGRRLGRERSPVFSSLDRRRPVASAVRSVRAWHVEGDGDGDAASPERAARPQVGGRTPGEPVCPRGDHERGVLGSGSLGKRASRRLDERPLVVASDPPEARRTIRATPRG